MKNFTFQFRRGPAAEWTADNPVLRNGEPGYEDDTKKLKLGDGVTLWNDLPYYPNISSLVVGVASVDGRTGVVVLSDLYAALSHAHAQSDITGLTSALSGKASTTHSHIQSDITGLSASLAGKSDTGHTHAQSDVTGLSASLAGKADTAHSHTQGDVTGLNASLAGKADISHAHAQSDITGLSASLAGKSDTGHAHAISDTTGLTSALAGKSDTGHTHAISDTTGLTSALAGKSDTTHNHVSGPTPVALTDGATIATDASLGNQFKVTIAGDRTLSNPTNMVDGQKCLWLITQGSGGNHGLALGTAFIFGADLTSITPSTSAGKVDVLGAVYNSTLGKWLVLAFTKGF